MRAAEFIVEEIVRTEIVNGMNIHVHSHLYDRAGQRKVSIPPIDNVIPKLASIRDKLASIEPGRRFWVYNLEQNISLGIRKLSPNNKEYLVKTVLPKPPHRYGPHPVFVIKPELDEGWREKAAAAMTAATLAYGGYNQLNKPEVTGQPTITQPDTKPSALKYRNNADTQNAALGQPAKKPFVLKFNDKNPIRDYLVQKGRAAGFTDLELAHLVSQVAHETMDFKHLEEIGTPKYFARKYDKKYNPRKARILGNAKPGDGERYKGRGFVHLTGRDNYTRAGQALGIDLVNKPQLAADPKIAADIAVWFWKNRVQPKVQDFPSATVAQVTQPINPGMKGLQDREAKFQKIANR